MVKIRLKKFHNIPPQMRFTMIMMKLEEALLSSSHSRLNKILNSHNDRLDCPLYLHQLLVGTCSSNFFYLETRNIFLRRNKRTHVLLCSTCLNLEDHNMNIYCHKSSNLRASNLLQMQQIFIF